ncbi:ABC transporter permease [Streptomyces sp. SID10815]|uniref:ABC transporter permease n=1 Tax=Streptomyces sp. SID10815 TaxID=2706027 RepID=UPI0013CD1925|nr:ABC transporter permease [Streptomyces sp. SID10815]NEA50006.1 ABC transporter permease [Streptomyces sp. SID10815]
MTPQPLVGNRTADELHRNGGSGKLPGSFRLGLLRGGVELKQFFRAKEVVVFTFALPIVMMTMFASIFHNRIQNAGVTVSQLYVAAMLGAGLMSTSFQSLGIGIATERDEGCLRRLRAMPLPRSAYFIGKLCLVLVTGVAETVLLLVAGVAFFGLELPTAPGKWFTFVWVLVLGMVSCSLLGIAMSSVPRHAKSAAPIMTLPFLILQFVSGVYISIDSVSGWMLEVGSLFPLKWMCQGLRSVFLPDRAKVLEQAGDWELGRVALVLGAWCIGGLVLCLTTFRWKNRRDG